MTTPTINEEIIAEFEKETGDVYGSNRKALLSALRRQAEGILKGLEEDIEAHFRNTSLIVSTAQLVKQPLLSLIRSSIEKLTK